MSIDLIRKQFQYGYWATWRILDQASLLSAEAFGAATGSPRDLRATLVHGLDTEWSWRLRLQGKPEGEWNEEMDAASFPDVPAIRQRWEMDRVEMMAWLESLDDARIDQPPGGEDLRFPLSYYLLHILHHSAQCRADAATIVSDLGHSPGDLDFLDWAAQPDWL